MSGKDYLRDREFNDISIYRESLVGQRIKQVEFMLNADEGLRIICQNGAYLCFKFSASEGDIAVGNK